MAINTVTKNQQLASGLQSPLATVFPTPIVANRAPTTSDKLQIGQLWCYSATNTGYVLLSVSNNSATWVAFTGAGAFNTLNLPNTNAAGTIGVIQFNGVNYMNNYSGGSSIFLGNLAGNPGNTGVSNTGMGRLALGALTTGNSNTCMGDSAGQVITTGANNVIIGSAAGSGMTTGNTNVVIGRGAGAAITTGLGHVIVGDSAYPTGTTGVNNTILAGGAGSSYTGAESNNILIDNAGVLGESNVIRIGTQGGGAGQQNTCWIAGIRGTTTGQNNAIAVLVDSTGQLGTVSSSARFKNSIRDMGAYSEAIYALKPKLFAYNTDQSSATQRGLIAEEVFEVLPDLVVHNRAGEIESVKYHELPVLILNELQKQQAVIQMLLSRIEDLEKKN